MYVQFTKELYLEWKCLVAHIIKLLSSTVRQFLFENGKIITNILRPFIQVI